jgi:hypothetical protein
MIVLYHFKIQKPYSKYVSMRKEFHRKDVKSAKENFLGFCFRVVSLIFVIDR